MIPYSLISSPWLPVRRLSGAEDTIAPAEIADADDPPVALLWPRADFNLACLELLVGMVFAACPPARARAWYERPDRAALRAALDRLEPAFRLDGPGPRFLQDLENLSGKPSGVDLLVIDSAGENAARKNADLMVRSDRFHRLGRPAAAMALYTLQAHAPSGGAGNRTSMRGGGPLVTLVEPRHADDRPTTLYDIVWANVPLGRPLAPDDLVAAFPWMRPTLTSEKGQMVHEADRRAAVGDMPARVEAFFGMPRRLRLVFEDDPGGLCPVTGRSDTVMVTGVFQRPRGTNYGVWRHPLTPYYRPKPAEAPLPVHPRPGPFGYRNWLGVALEDPADNRLRATTVSSYLFDRRDVEDRDAPDPVLLVGGWAMSNMSPLDFVFSRHPLLTANDPADTDAQRALEDRARNLVEAGNLVHRLLLGACMSLQHDAPADKGDLPAVTESFFTRTEDAFFAALGRLKEAPEEAGAALVRALRQVALAEFEALALPGLPDRKPEHAQRVVRAHRHLVAALSGYGTRGVELFARLGLDPPPSRKSRQEEPA